PVNRHDGETPGLSGLETGMQPDPRVLSQLIRPAQSEVSQTGRFSFNADRLLKCDSLIDRRLGCRGTRSDFFKLANIGVASLRSSLHRPGLCDAIFSYVEQARPERRQKP